MQKRKSFLLKLFVLLTVVFCTFALVFGMVGCAAGEKGEAGRGIANTKIENGKLYVQYTDSTTWVEVGQVAGEDGEDGEDGKDGAQGGTLGDCETHDFAKHVIRYANCSEGGLAIEICSKCRGYQTVETPVDEDVHGSYELKPDANGVMKLEFTSYGEKAGKYRPATCTEDGFNHTVCSKCGETLNEGIIPKINHMVTKENGDKVDAYKLMTGARENGNKCMHGDYTAYVCTLCFDIDEEGITVTDSEGTKVHTKPVYTPAREHHTADATWNLILQPTETTKGSIEGICTYCNEEQTIELPAFNETYEGAPAYDVDVPTCVEAAAALNAAALKKTYSLSAAWVAKYGYSATFEFAYTITHKLTHNSEDFYFEHGALTSYSFEKVSALINANATTTMRWSAEPGNCQDTGYAIFTCADCHKEVVVQSKGGHAYVDVTDDNGRINHAATCTEAGYYEQKCTVCNDVRELPTGEAALGHYFVKEGDEIVNSNGTVTFTAVCDRECGVAAVTVTGTKNAQESTGATCEDDGVDVYDLDKTINGKNTFEVVVPKLEGHKLTIATGDYAGDYVFKHGEATEYDYDVIEAIIADASNNMRWSAEPGNCAEEGFAIFTCPTCHGEIIVKSNGDCDWHDVVDENGDLIVHEQTCTTGEYHEEQCSRNSEHVRRIYNALKPALGHAWSKDGDVVKNSDGTVTITAKCSRNCGVANKTFTGTLNEDADKTFDSTCSTEGQEYYDLTEAIDGKSYFIITLDKLAEHKLVLNNVTYLFAHGAVTEYSYEVVNALINDASNDMRWSAEPGNCQDTGFAIFTCPDCNKEIVVQSMGSHAWNTIKNEDGSIIYTPATCEKAEYYVEKCAVCGEENEIETANKALGHNWVKVGDAVQNADGTVTITAKCSRECGAENITITGVLRDADGDGVTIPADCDSAAINIYDYKINGVDAEISITVGEPLGHNYIPEEALTWKVTVGTKTYQCTGKICQVCHVLVVFDMVEIV